MALTATANQQVRDDVKIRLGIEDCMMLEQSFNRPNLKYEIRAKGAKVMSDIAEWIKAKHRGHTGVIYCRTKMDCEKLAEQLQGSHRLSAEFYHADLDTDTKNGRLRDWLDGNIKIMVATVRAFLLSLDPFQTICRSRLAWVLTKQMVSAACCFFEVDC